MFILLGKRKMNILVKTQNQRSLHAVQPSTPEKLSAGKAEYTKRETSFS